MNIYDLDVMLALKTYGFENQRKLASDVGCSLGIVNRALKTLFDVGYLDEKHEFTPVAQDMFRAAAPKRAIILAAGYGMRMVPINYQMPKALLEINGKPIIEHQIQQLHEVGITEILVVVGFMKERFEYLIDQYGVQLVINKNYSTRNNLHSLNCVKEKLENAYIIPCDVWTKTNPFNTHELYSWYMVSDQADESSNLRVNRKRELVVTKNAAPGNHMVGIAYVCEKDAPDLRNRLMRYCADPRWYDSFWESVLYNGKHFLYPAKMISALIVSEFNTYEDLREYDRDSKQLEHETIDIISRTLNVSAGEITDFSVLKKGMTNRSFLFTCQNNRYIMRIPGEGTSELIDRNREAAVYNTINPLSLCDRVLYINPSNGYKLTKYIPNARTCDPQNVADVKKCMQFLRKFHERQLVTPYYFDLFDQIEYYESLWDGSPSDYPDYFLTKENVMSLKDYVTTHAKPYSLTHIDAVSDNFLFYTENGEEHIRLIDWEYASMQDPDVDLAMFCIYALYSKEQVDALIDMYYPEGTAEENRTKIYCYIAICGLLWSNWCEYKRILGVEFGEYALRQYRYAKEYYRLVQKELARRAEDNESN